ncbi:hypothetical protein SKAU_G00422430 [Synaphobranchus kaupii]|uniref:Uncharacterized protein n=1 Tax=Synaphobranchus kaupii TaxID=118154 RepID=A0A9Q1IB92_SYNKA|nr:hypothetical protein SKAU_G00422430 [Synaphobranchus kaupii]
MDSLGEEWDEDVDTQRMIEQSLLDFTKHSGCGGAPPPKDESSAGTPGSKNVTNRRDSRPRQHKRKRNDFRLPDATTEIDRIFTAIRTGDVEKLAELWDQYEPCSEADSRGWTSTTRGCSPVQQEHPADHLLSLPAGGRAEPDAAWGDPALPRCRARSHGQRHLPPSERLQPQHTQRGGGLPTDLRRAFSREPPLHEASHLGLENFVHLLLQSGAELEPSSAYNRTPPRPGCAERTPERGTRTAPERCEGKRPGLWTQPLYCMKQLVLETLTSSPLLLEYGADANLPNRTGHLPIHRAAHHGHLL